MGTASDLTFIRTFAGGDSNKIKKYVGMFLNMASPAMDQMDLFCSQNDWKSLKTTSHSLKSQMKYMGMAKGADIAQQIENICGEGVGVEQIPDLLTSLRSEVETAVAELQEELDKL
jgi:HPt (histidine-containing phosphotransfer) domain-containing protein